MSVFRLLACSWIYWSWASYPFAVSFQQYTHTTHISTPDFLGCGIAVDLKNRFWPNFHRRTCSYLRLLSSLILDDSHSRVRTLTHIDTSGSTDPNALERTQTPATSSQTASIEFSLHPRLLPHGKLQVSRLVDPT